MENLFFMNPKRWYALLLSSFLITGALFVIYDSTNKIAIDYVYESYTPPQVDQNTTMAILKKYPTLLTSEFQPIAINITKELLLSPYNLKKFQHFPINQIEGDNGYFYFFHSHRKNELGHFHIFSRNETSGYAHLIGISLSPQGEVIRLFIPGSWVTKETPIPLEEQLKKIEGFCLKKEGPYSTLNQWVERIFSLFKPQILYLNEKKYEKKFHLDEEILLSLDVSEEIQIKIAHELKRAYSY